MADVFIGYSHEDIQAMYSVLGHLLTRGITVWTDRHLQPGTPSWTAAVDKAIIASKCVVIILSPSAKGSKWVDTEIVYAGLYEKPIFPLLAAGDEQISLPVDLGTTQLQDIRGKEFEHGMQTVVNSMMVQVGIGTQTSTTRWDRVGSLYWLAGDLRLLRVMLQTGNSPKKLVRHFKQCMHHAERLNLKLIASKLRRLMFEAEGYLQEAGQLEDPHSLQYYSDGVRSIFHEVAQLVEEQDPDFDNGLGRPPTMK